MTVHNHISRLTLRNIRSFVGEERFPLRPLTLLFGTNGSGKTTCLESLAVFLQSIPAGGHAGPGFTENGHILKTRAANRMKTAGRDSGDASSIGITIMGWDIGFSFDERTCRDGNTHANPIILEWVSYSYRNELVFKAARNRNNGADSVAVTFGRAFDAWVLAAMRSMGEYILMVSAMGKGSSKSSKRPLNDRRHSDIFSAAFMLDQASEPFNAEITVAGHFRDEFRYGEFIDELQQSLPQKKPDSDLDPFSRLNAHPLYNEVKHGYSVARFDMLCQSSLDLIGHHLCKPMLSANIENIGSAPLSMLLEAIKETVRATWESLPHLGAKGWSDNIERREYYCTPMPILSKVVHPHGSRKLSRWADLITLHPDQILPLLHEHISSLSHKTKACLPVRQPLNSLQDTEFLRNIFAIRKELQTLLSNVADKPCKLGIQSPEGSISWIDEGTLPSDNFFGRIVVEMGSGSPPVPIDDLAEGWRQLLPILYDVCTSGLTLIQQPELHLHPKLQAYLAPSLLKHIARIRPQKNDENYSDISESQCIVETHSEFLLSETAKWIRDNPLYQDWVKILLVSKRETDGSAFVVPVNINADGSFDTIWDIDFFPRPSSYDE